MAWRGLHVAEACRLTLADGQIVVDRAEDSVRIAVEDVAWVVIDTPRATLTTALISALMEAGVALVTTDSRHHPSGLMLPFHRHHRQGAVAAMQAGLSPVSRGRLWQAVVQRKIANQAELLDVCGAGGAAVRAMVRWVAPGDADNVEARAARAYWTALFADFVRSDAGDVRNAMLDYGYAVMRAAVARSLVAAGLLPVFGIGHAGQANAFNLADDMIEPFRPFVDRLVRTLAEEAEGGELTIGRRRRLAALPLEEARIGAETATLLVCCELVAESLVRAMETGKPSLLLLPHMLVSE